MGSGQNSSPTGSGLWCQSSTQVEVLVVVFRQAVLLLNPLEVLEVLEVLLLEGRGGWSPAWSWWRCSSCSS